MNSIIQAILISLLILVIGGGLGWAGWLMLRRKKESWPAIVYKLSDSKFDPPRDSEGKIIEGAPTLFRLVPYAHDKLVKDSKGLRLATLRKSVSDVDADTINDFRKILPKVGRYVEILSHEGTCTLIKSGYNKDIGFKIFRPMPYDRSNALMADVSEKKERYTAETEGWLRALPWIGIIILVIGIVVTAVIVTNTLVKISDNQAKSAALIYDYQKYACGNLPPPSVAAASTDNLGSQTQT